MKTKHKIMFSTTYKVLLIVVLTYLTLECTAPSGHLGNEANDRYKEALRRTIAECLSKMASYYGKPIAEDIYKYKYYADENRLTGLDCAIQYKKELKMFPDDAKAALDIALKEFRNEANDRYKEDLKRAIAQCLSKMASYYGKPIPGDIYKYNYYADENRLTGLDCAKNAIQYKRFPRDVYYSSEEGYYNELKNNLTLGKIMDKAEFCKYVKPSTTTSILPQCLTVDNNTSKAKECMKELKMFPDDAKAALDIALKKFILEDFNGQVQAYTYMSHLIDEVRVKSTIDEPNVYCDKKHTLYL